MVNFIHRQFQTFLKEIDAEYCDLSDQTGVKWLNRGKVLFRFQKLRKEINICLTQKRKVDLILSNPI